jgi:hypothetical protein
VDDPFCSRTLALLDLKQSHVVRKKKCLTSSDCTKESRYSNMPSSPKSREGQFKKNEIKTPKENAIKKNLREKMHHKLD